jgi:hypothetical protein
MALDYTLGLAPLDPATSVLAHAIGTGLTVLHKDILTATLLPLEPYSVIEERNPTNAQKHCVIRNTKNLPWVELYPVVGNSPLPASPLKGRLFGFAPDIPENATAHSSSPTTFVNGRRMPQDIDPSNFDDTLQGLNPNPRSSETTLSKRETGYWLPCKALGASAPGLLSFNNEEVARQTDTTGGRKILRVLEPIICYVAGFRDILFTVEVPITAPATSGMLLARFSS